MKTDESPSADERGHRPEEAARSRRDDRQRNGSAGPAIAAPDEAAGAPPGGVEPSHVASAAGAPLPAPVRSRLLRLVYWLVWFVLLPVVFACLIVWALTPSGSAELGGALGWVQSLVRSQPVPVGIVLFTVAEVALWAARHQLPLAAHAHPPLRSDLAPPLRPHFERARALVDDAEMILVRHEKAIVRDVTARERERLRDDLVALRDAMERVPFDEDAFVDAFTRAEHEIDARLARWRKSEVREYVEAIVMAVAVAFALRTFVIEAFKIPSGSMIPTLMVGDHIFVNKFSYGPAIPFTKARVWTSMPPRRGDVMVFAFPEHPEQ
ncbi:MAG: signal peptidase I, partial [Myxococcales bacterium]|nr:signal peptidase I [Myxococcales bacterium]